MKSLILLSLCLVTSLQAVLISDRDWRKNADTIIRLHESNRNDMSFLNQFNEYNAALYSEYENADDRDYRTRDKALIALFFNSRLILQYARDKELNPEYIRKNQELVKEISFLVHRERIPLSHVTKQLDAYRRAFTGYPELRLRTL